MERTGKRGQPRKWCAECRLPPVRTAAVCPRCNKRLPDRRNSLKVYCSDRCGNSAWVAAHRAALKALAAKPG